MSMNRVTVRGWLLAICVAGTAGVRVGRSNPWRLRGVNTGRTDMPPLEETAAKLGVRAPFTAPKFVWGAAWKTGKRALPVLHRVGREGCERSAFRSGVRMVDPSTT